MSFLRGEEELCELESIKDLCCGTAHSGKVTQCLLIAPSAIWMQTAASCSGFSLEQGIVDHAASSYVQRRHQTWLEQAERVPSLLLEVVQVHYHEQDAKGLLDG